MTRTEDRLTDALGAVADAVPEETLRPLVTPPAAWPRLRWLAPGAAAASVVLLASLVTVVVTLAGGSRGTPGPTTLRKGVPRYYAEADLDGRITVRSTTTGRVTATLPLRAPAGTVGVVSSAGSGLFFAAGVPGHSPLERVYRFRVTAAGQVAGLTAVRGGLLGPRQAVDALAAVPGGDRVAVSLVRLARSAGPATGDTLMVIDTATGQRTSWQNGTRGRASLFRVANLSWTGDGRGLAVLGVWCRAAPAGLVRSSIVCPGTQADRTAEVRLLRPVRGHYGGLADGQLLLSQSARYPYLAQAVISPDGKTLTVMALTGRKIGPDPGGPGVVPGDLTVSQIAVPSGRPLGVLYRRPLGPTFERTSLAPDFLSLTRDSSGRHWIMIAGVYHPINGWLQRGRLVPLTRSAGMSDPSFEAW